MRYLSFIVLCLLAVAGAAHAATPGPTNKERVLAQLLSGQCITNGYFNKDDCSRFAGNPFGCGPEVFECPFSDVLGDPDKLEVMRTFYNFNGSVAHTDKMVVSPEAYWGHVRDFEEALAKPQPRYGLEPDVVHPDTQLNISLPEEHPAELGVEDPDGEWIYVIDRSFKYSFFKEAGAIGADGTSLSFKAKDLAGIRFDADGKQRISKVFTKPGVYHFYFADNLEMEPDNTFSLEYAVSYEP